MAGPRRIRITAGDVAVTAALSGSGTADQLWDALPVRSVASTWGDEIYFSVPIDAAEADDARAEQDVGAVAYWPAGSALCLFFGPTPASVGDRPAAISPVNPVGTIEGDALALRAVRPGAQVAVERA